MRDKSERYQSTGRTARRDFATYHRGIALAPSDLEVLLHDSLVRFGGEGLFHLLGRRRERARRERERERVRKSKLELGDGVSLN